MRYRVLSIAGKNVNHRLADSLIGTQIELVCQTDIPQAIDQLNREKFDLVLIDEDIQDLGMTCFRINWFCRIPVALMIKGDREDWNKLNSLDVDGFIPREVDNMESIAHFQTISRRGKERNDQARLLIIEDDEQIRETLRLSFEIFWPEARIIFAECGQKGLDTARTEPVDAIILDLLLPDISGFDVLTEIRRFSDKPVIILTADHKSENFQKAKICGASDYILKPFKQTDLFSKIKHHIKINASMN
jgi:DNA-binding response OmpR family regulator